MTATVAASPTLRAPPAAAGHRGAPPAPVLADERPRRLDSRPAYEIDDRVDGHTSRRRRSPPRRVSWCPGRGAELGSRRVGLGTRPRHRHGRRESPGGARRPRSRPACCVQRTGRPRPVGRRGRRTRTPTDRVPPLVRRALHGARGTGARSPLRDRPRRSTRSSSTGSGSATTPCRRAGPSYQHRLRYYTYDVTGLLRDGGQRDRGLARRRVVPRADGLARRVPQPVRQ